MDISGETARNLLLGAWRDGVAAADPALLAGNRFPPAPAGRLCIVAAGKGALAMARAALRHYADSTDRIEGLVAAPGPLTGSAGPLTCIEAEHPVPGPGSFRAGEEAVRLARSLGPGDHLLCLVSGGASALLVAPDGISQAEMQALYRDLLASGAAIHELNTVRRKICLLKGGGLARLAAPAGVTGLLFSDVIGDDPAVIGSGLTVPDPDTPAAALAVLDRYGLAHPAVRSRLTAPEEAAAGPSPEAAETVVIGGTDSALEGAASSLRGAGVRPYILADSLEGDSEQAAGFHAALVQRLLRRNEPFDRPCVLLSGGETTVRLPEAGAGTGGPNSHFLLALAVRLWGRESVCALAADTDGRDGSGGAAGGLLTPALFRQARRSEAEAALTRHDSGTFLRLHGHDLVSGPSGTNVNDLRLILVGR